MKLNNLSRLTALLLALTIFLSSVAFADPVAETEWDSTSYLTMLSAVAEDCLCVTYYASALPLDKMNGYTCVYEFLSTLGTTDQYQFLVDLDNGQYQYLIYEETNKYSSYSVSDFLGAYYAHIDGTSGTMLDPLMCTCTDNLNGTYFNYEPGNGKHNEGCPWTEATETSTVIKPPLRYEQPEPLKPELFEQYASNDRIDLSVWADRVVVLPALGRATLETDLADGYQWQVFDGNVWVDIEGENNRDLIVTGAKLASIWQLTDIAQLRYYDATNSVVLATAYVTSEEIANGEYVEPVAEAAQGLSLISKEGEETAEVVTITVRFEYSDMLGNPAPDKTYVLPKNLEGYTVNNVAANKVVVELPNVLGYEPTFNPSDAETTPPTLDAENLTLTLAAVNVDATKTYIVRYVPAKVGFKITPHLQNLTDDNYTADTANTLTISEGRTNATVGQYRNQIMQAVGEKYPGFTMLLFETDELIAADGSTNIEIYLDRNYYLMKFDLGDGGYGMEPIYARYEAPLTVTDPTRPGYAFIGWKLEGDTDPDKVYTSAELSKLTMPVGGATYVAQWTAQKTEYARAYWVVHEDGSKTYIGSEIVAAESGSIVSGGDTLTVDTYVCGMAEHTHDDTCVKLCTLRDHVHDSDTCNYSCGKQEHDHSSGCYCTEAVHTEHTRDCYVFTAATVANSSATETPTYYTTQDGFAIYRAGNHGNRRYYVLINDNYYQITNYGYNTSLEYQLTCHYHTSACCTIEAHEHNAGCCDLHAHDTTCYSCGAVEHTHVDDCKTDLAKYVQFEDADQNVTVEGDGSSIVNVNYEYKTYTIRFIYARQNGTSYDIATLTRNGVLTNCDWGESGSNTLPTFVDPSRKTERSTVRIGNYTYYYISLTAKYGEDIADKWPSANIGEAGNFKWGSWAAEYGTGYRIKYGDEHANIVGPYPIMSADMIVDNPTLLEDGTYLAQNMIAWWGYSAGEWYEAYIAPHAYHNYFELLPGEEMVDGETYLKYEGKTYKLVQTYTFTAAHNGDTRVDPIYFNGYHCVNDSRDTNNDTQANSQNFPNNGNCAICGDACKYCNTFYYDRNVHKLYFWNHNGYLQSSTGRDVVFGDALTEYGNLVNEEFMEQPVNYPEGLEANAYQFAGWYTTADCLDGTEVDWNTATMPDADVTFYAKWAPVTKTITFYLDEAALNAGNALSNTNGFEVRTVPFGTVYNSAYEGYQTIGTPERGEDQFIGWFYKDENGVEKAFDFNTMPVKRDLQVYAKWSTNVMVDFVVKYHLANEDGTDIGVEVAADTVGQILNGHLRTFYPKIEGDLYADYQTGYYPMVASHSLTVDANDPTKNTYTFLYKKADGMPYTVYYVTETENKVYNGQQEEKVTVNGTTYYRLRDDKYVDDNTHTVVTENYVHVEGFLPKNKEYQKVLILSLEKEKNVIVFIYEANANSTSYIVTHYFEDEAGNVEFVNKGDETKKYRAGIQDIRPAIVGDQITETFNSISGYEPAGSNYDKGGSASTARYEATTETVVITEDGGQVHFHLYYNEKNATFGYYVAMGQGTVSPGSETLKVISGTPQGSVATAAPGYVFDGWYLDPECTVPVGTAGKVPDGHIVPKPNAYYPRYVLLDDGTTQTTQVPGYAPDSFYAKFVEQEVTINYVVVGPEGCGTVNLVGDTEVAEREDSETTKMVTGSARGATADPNDSTFKFVGWYSDEACMQKVSDNLQYVPEQPGRTTDKDGNVVNGVWPDSTTYYAKFEYNLTSMTITKTGMSAGESAIFTVTTEEYSSDTWTVVVANDATVTLYGLTVGATYNIAEDGNWSWRYDATKISTKSITIDADPTKNAVVITNVKDNDQWLSDESFIVNFDGTNQ